MKLPVTRVEAIFEAPEPWKLPAYSGSPLRGALGRAMRRTGCARTASPCVAECELPTDCAYAAIHDATLSPVIPTYPAVGPWQLGPDEPLRLQFCVIGTDPEPALQALERALEAFEDEPLGRGGNRVTLESISRLGRRAQVVELTPLESWQGELTIETTTPLWLSRGDEKVVIAPDFSFLFARIHWRLRQLCEAFGEVGEEADAHHAHLKQLAERIDTMRVDFTRHRWRRYSTEREHGHAMHGITGRAIYEGPVGAFETYMKAAELVAVGKHVSFGLGRISVSASRALSAA